MLDTRWLSNGGPFVKEFEERIAAVVGVRHYIAMCNARRYMYPGIHGMEPYRSHFSHAGLLLEKLEALVERVIDLPTGTGVNSADIEKICALIRSAVEHRRDISEALAVAVQSPAGSD